jgi:hypothetical protein
MEWTDEESFSLQTPLACVDVLIVPFPHWTHLTILLFNISKDFQCGDGGIKHRGRGGKGENMISYTFTVWARGCTTDKHKPPLVPLVLGRDLDQ